MLSSKWWKVKCSFKGNEVHSRCLSTSILATCHSSHFIGCEISASVPKRPVLHIPPKHTHTLLDTSSPAFSALSTFVYGSNNISLKMNLIRNGIPLQLILQSSRLLVANILGFCFTVDSCIHSVCQSLPFIKPCFIA